MRIALSSHWAPAKAKLWLQRNHDRLKIPIRAQLGATINFQAGTVQAGAPAHAGIGASSGYGVSRKSPGSGGAIWPTALSWGG